MKKTFVALMLTMMGVMAVAQNPDSAVITGTFDSLSKVRGLPGTEKWIVYFHDSDGLSSAQMITDEEARRIKAATSHPLLITVYRSLIPGKDRIEIK